MKNLKINKRRIVKALCSLLKKILIFIPLFMFPLLLVGGFYVSNKLSIKWDIDINNLGFNNNDWLGFWGAYISSLTTIYVLYKTTKQTRSIQVENHKNSIKPSVDLDISDGGWIIYKEDEQNIYIDEIVLGRKNTDEPYDQEKNTMHDIWELKLDIINLSQNPAKNIKIIIQPLYEDFKINLQELKLPFKYSDKNKIIEIDDAGYLDFKKNLKENETEYRHLGSNRVIEHTVYVPFLGYKDVFDKLLEQYISTANYFITGDSEFKKKNLCTYNISLYYQDVELTEYNKQFKLDFIIYYVSKKDHRVSVEIKITDFSVK